MKELLLLFVLFCVTFSFSQAVISSSIPTHLVECYRSGGPVLKAPKRLDVFLTLLRRLELDTRLDMRLFSSALLRSIRLDGIEESTNTLETETILPFRASAFQFHKYKLLMELFLPSQTDLMNVDESLNREEKCLLHKMISSTVRPWERGDESVVCPLSLEHREMMQQNANRIYSRCPVEQGVIQTEWGTISPGILIGALASSLEPQQVTVRDILNANIFKEEISQALLDSAMEDWELKIEKFDVDANTDTEPLISSTWVSTLAGDIAEVVVNQGPRVGASPHNLLLGSSNRWNDSILPRDYYIFPQNGTLPNWHFTDAEILAGIDGLILANYLPSWVNQRRSLRLSQVIEMYYSNEGVSFEPNVRACNRQTLFSNIVNRSQLFTEASRFAHILSLQQITVYIPKDEMERITEAAVTSFMNYVPIVLTHHHKECSKVPNPPTIDLIVATDSSWKGYEVEQFMSWIGDALEVDAQRSTIGLLHGNTAQWIVPPVSNLTTFFSNINNNTIHWPNRFNLPNTLSRIIEHCRNQTLQEIAAKTSAGHNTVVLIVSPTDRPSNDEIARSRSLMNSLRSSFFDIYFAYVAEDVTIFQNLNNEYLDYSELFLTVNSKSVADVVSTVNIDLIQNNIPSRIIGAQCDVNGTQYLQTPYEDYVLPDRVQLYRIHPFYLRLRPLVNVQFRNDGQGQIMVCLWRGSEAEVYHSCHKVNAREVHIFNMSNPCPSPEFCLPAQFSVTALKSENVCAHNECRMPHQVGYYIQHSGFRCLPLLGAAAALSPFGKVFVLSLMISLSYFYK